MFSQSLTKDKAEEFIQLLIEESDDLQELVLPEELKLSNRFNINYDDVKFKFLISYDIDHSLRDKIKKNKENYEVQIHKLKKDFSRLEFRVPAMNYQKDFYFKGKYLTSPIYYHTFGWKLIESEHFIFVVSDPGLFNSYCIENLEKFVNSISTVLEFDEEQIKNIQSQKIYYFLCKNEDEIEKLTSFRTRGIYNLAFDYVITTFNNHYHELMHLLINYKLQKLPLYTHPFFQEGFAVAFGGRGGKEPGVILDLGLFLQQSNMLGYSELLSKQSFYQVDVSLSYPLSGLYNLFLVDKLGIDTYLKLYLKYSGSAEEINQMVISRNDLPNINSWESFLVGYSCHRTIEIEKEQNNFSDIFHNSSVRIYEDSTHYFFQMKDTLLIPAKSNLSEFQSKKFVEVFKDREYSGEKYLMIANSNEVAIYNLYTNNLISNYISSFSVPMKLVPEKEGFFEFYVLKNLFDEPLSEIINRKVPDSDLD